MDQQNAQTNSQQNTKDIEFKYLESQITVASEQLDKVDEQHAKLRLSIEAIKELSSKDTANARVPIVEGIYTQAKLLEPNVFYVDVGADVVVKKTAEEVITLLDEQLQKTQEYQQKLHERLVKLSKQADEINAKKQ